MRGFAPHSFICEYTLIRKHFLVIGCAKTGTTVVSKTIQSSLQTRHYALEPKAAGYFEAVASGSQGHPVVIKILFDHWRGRPRLLNSIIHDESQCGYGKPLFIVRDPRAQLISRLLYVAYHFKNKPAVTAVDKSDWLNFFERKETDKSYSLLQLVSDLKDRFQVNVLDGAVAISEGYARTINSLGKLACPVLRYENFMINEHQRDFDDTEFQELLAEGPKEVSQDLIRTRRTGGLDDWTSFLSDQADLEFLNDRFKGCLEAWRYPVKVPISASLPEPTKCSKYVSKLLSS